jgi:DNA-binding NarL/FixJ family response regulator
MTSSLTNYINAIAWRHLSSSVEEEKKLAGNLALSKLLIINDSGCARREFIELLAQAGFNNIKQTSSEDTIVAIKRERPDIIIMEFELPILNGPLFCHQIKHSKALNAYADIPVLFYSSINESVLALLTNEYSAQGYIHKTESEDVVIRKLQKIAAKL